MSWKTSSYITHTERERERVIRLHEVKKKEWRTLQSSTWCGGTQIQRDGRVFLQCHSRRSSERERERMLFSFFFFFSCQPFYLDGIDIWIFFFLSFRSFVRSFSLKKQVFVWINLSFPTTNTRESQSQSQSQRSLNSKQSIDKLKFWKDDYDESFHNFRLVLRETNKKRFLHNHYYHHNKQQTNNKHGDDEQQQYQQQDQLFYYHDVPIGLFIFISINSYC